MAIPVEPMDVEYNSKRAHDLEYLRYFLCRGNDVRNFCQLNASQALKAGDAEPGPLLKLIDELFMEYRKLTDNGSSKKLDEGYLQMKYEEHHRLMKEVAGLHTEATREKRRIEKRRREYASLSKTIRDKDRIHNQLANGVNQLSKDTLKLSKRLQTKKDKYETIKTAVKKKKKTTNDLGREMRETKNWKRTLQCWKEKLNPKQRNTA